MGGRLTKVDSISSGGDQDGLDSKLAVAQRAVAGEKLEAESARNVRSAVVSLGVP